jgi:predicted nuclease of restriction endonuclease-like (RecB) superfamily
VRELKRQIASLYYERSGLSMDKGKLAELTHKDAERAEPTLTVRDPYVFEFLGLKSAEVMGESQLEDQMLDKLQGFLLELGHGFCFEARQKRTLIGEQHNFIDLVFYHRILKCHVLVELKVAAFSHENIGQLNTYVSWYREHMMSEGDQLPVGIWLKQTETPEATPHRDGTDRPVIGVPHRFCPQHGISRSDRACSAVRSRQSPPPSSERGREGGWDCAGAASRIAVSWRGIRPPPLTPPAKTFPHHASTLEACAAASWCRTASAGSR